jgi:release factor glutamine methyltransferase
MSDPETMTIQQTLMAAAARLADAGMDTARLDAEVLLRHALGVDRTRLFVVLPDPMPEEIAGPYDDLISRRVSGEPVAYLVGKREFMGLEFRTTPEVLIPRPDTEPLVEWALEWLERRPDARVADIGTGSGAIAVSLAAQLPASFTGEIIAVDISPEALEVAEANADSVLTAEQRARLTFVQGSLTEPLDGPVDLILANLPYLTPAQMAENPDLEAEPSLALLGGKDGLDLVRATVADLPRILAADGAAGFEIDPSQAAATRALLQRIFPEAHTLVLCDLAGRERHVVVDRRSG